MKGLYTLLMGLLLLLGTQQLAGQPLGVSVESASGAVNDEICLQLTGTNFDRISGFQFSLDYDPTVLQFNSSTGSVFFGQTVFIQNNSTDGEIRVLWSIFSADELTDVGPFSLGEICFTVLQAAETNIAITSSPISIEFNSNAGPVNNPTLTDGVVNAGQGPPAPTCDDGIQNGTETGIDCGGSCDPCMTQPTCDDGIQNGTETGVDCGGSCTPCMAQPTCDDGIQNGTETGIDCGGSCDPCMTQPTCDDGIQNGTETGVDCGGSCTPCSLGGDDLAFQVSSTTGAVGTEVCLDVSTENFTSIGAFQFSMAYDNSVLTYNAASNLAFNDINVIQPSSTPGEIRVSWVYFNADGLGETLTDGSRVFTICFNVVQATGTNVDITGNPLGIEAFDNMNNELDVATSNGTVNGGGTGPTCNDGIQNGTETGVDCGGSCTPCMTQPTCNDGIQNGTETGVDCGGSCAPCSTGGDDLSFQVSNGSGAVGTEVCLNVTTENFTSIGGFQFSMSYDQSILSYNGASNLAFNDINVVQPSGNPGQIRVSWVYFNSDGLGETLTDGAAVFTVCFNVVQSTGTGVNITASPLAIEAFDNENNPIAVVVGNGTVNGGGPVPTCSDGIQNGTETGVDCGGSCAACQDVSTCEVSGNNLTLCLSDECEDVGEQACMDIVVHNFDAVAGFDFRVNYAGGNLDYTSMVANPAFVGGVTVNDANDGQLVIFWSDPTVEFEGATIPDDEVAFTFCFEVENTLATPINLSLVSFGSTTGATLNTDVNPGSINAAACNTTAPTCTDGIQNGNETGVDCGGPDCAACPPTCNDGILNGTETGVDCGGSCAPCNTGNEICGEGSNDMHLCVESLCDVATNEQICVGIDVTQFTDITGVQFNIIYTGANLQYVSSSSNPALTNGASINPFSDGELRVLWFDPDPEFLGVSIPGGSGELLNICFNAENTSASTITITGESISNVGGAITPIVINPGSINAPGCNVMPTCNDGVQNGDETGVDCGGSCAPCMTGGGDCTVNGSNLTFCIEDVCADAGTQACVDVITHNFNDVTGMQFAVDYTGASLDYSSSTQNSAFPNSISVNENSDGQLTILWFDPTPAFEGVDIPDGEVMITFCFDVENDQATTIDFSDASFTNPQGQAITPLDITAGSVNGPGCDGVDPTCDDGIQNGNETGVDCGGPDCAACPPDPTCDDGIQNGNETGVDCGGSCEPCMVEEMCEVNGDNLTFCIGNVCADAGTQACVDVITHNFNAVTGMQFAVDYTGANLDYSSSTQNSAFPNSISVNENSDGQLTILWFDPTPAFEGVDIPDGEVMITFCFDVENDQAATIDFSDASFTNPQGQAITPLDVTAGSVNGPDCDGVAPTCDDGIQNGNETGIDCGGPDCAACPPDPTCDDGIQNGNETGIDCGGSCAPCMVEEMCEVNGDNLTFCIGNVCADAGTQACVDVVTHNFNDVTGMQFQVDYTGASLDYSSSTQNSAFPNGISVNENGDGQFTVLWFDPTPEFLGIDIPNGEVMMTFCFDVENGQAATIDFSDASFTNPQGQAIMPLDITAGSVNGPDCGGVLPTCDDGIQNGNETGVDCGGPDCAACPPTCDDGIQNGNETGVDCGGPDCAACPPTCDDGIQNGNETGIDCGGPDCAACPTGQEDVTLSIADGSGAVGDQVCLGVTVADFNSIRGLDFSLNYNSSLLQLSSITATTSLTGFGSSSFMMGGDGVLNVDWTGTVPQGLPDDAILFTVCFTIIGEGTSMVSITNGGTATAGDGSTVDIISNSGTVSGTNNFENLTFIMGSAIGAEGEEVCLEVPVYNFTNVTSFSFTISYDPNKVSFNELVANADFPPGGGYQVTNPNPGEVRVLWLYNPPDFAGVTAADGTIAFSACFTIIEACETSVDLTDTPTDIAASDNNGDALEVTVVNGTINDEVACGSCDPENLILDITDASGALGTEVCLDVNVENFNGMTDLQFTLNYDPDVLGFNNFDNFGLGSITASNFTIGPAGRIIFDWSSPNVDGQSMVDGNSLFTMCFTIDQVAQTSLVFTSTPTPILAMNGCGANVGVIPMSGMVNQGSPMGDDLTLQILCVDGEVNETVCVPIQTFNFEDILGFQFSLDYDPAQLDFVELAPNPAFPFLVNESAPGDIRVNWSDLGGATETIPDGGNLGEFCFTILTTDSAPLSFSNTPIQVEFFNGDGQAVVPTLVNCAINSAGGPRIEDVIIRNPTCHDAADGRIELVVTGSSNLRYNWNPNPSMSMSSVLENVSAGTTYTVEVVDLTTGESTMEIISIEQLIAFNPTLEVENVDCFGESDGVITVTPIGGTGPYIYDWSGNLQDNIPQQTGLDGGTYGVTVTDDNGCRQIFDNIMLTEPNGEIVINGIVNDISDQPGSIMAVNVMNAASPIDYSWTGPEGFTWTLPNISNLTVEGTYCLSIEDNNGCTDVRCFSVGTALSIFEAEISEACADQSNGFIDITVAGGLGTYTYNWEGPNEFEASTQDINSLSPGIYLVTITSGPDVITGSYSVDELGEITIGSNVTIADAGNNGAIDIMPSGGLPIYTYGWSNGEATQDIDMLAPGEYCVTVTDSRGCDRSSCFSVESIPISIVSFVTTPTTCVDDADGTARIVLANGVAPYIASVTPGGATATSDTDTVLVTGLNAGTYTVMITDDQANVISQEVTVTAPSVIVVADTSIVSDTEDAQCTGSITLMIEGGTPDYTVEWNLPSLSGPQVTGLCAGDYQATITDANGCSIDVVEVTIAQLNESAEASMVECEGDNSGTIDLTVEGGAGTYTFAWRRVGEADILATTEDLSGLTAGEYEVTIMDATGATLVRTYEVTTALGFSFTASATSNYNGFGVSCNGASDGELTVTVSGMGTYSYEWFLGDVLVGVDPVLTGAAAGEYTVRVLSDAGCEQTSEMITLTQPNELGLTSSVTNVSCINERDGLITVVVTGGTGNYDYAWTNGSTLPRAQFLSEGDYSVFVTDDNGCEISADFTITEPEELIVTTEATDADDGCNGTVTVLPLGGAGNYNYRWPQLPAQGNDPVARGLCPGEYTVEIFDENDCQTVTVIAEVRDRRFPCLSERNVITPNGDGLNEAFILFCTDGSEVSDNNLEIYNRWGQLVYKINDYSCSEDGGLNCFEGRTNDGAILPEGPYYYVLDYFNPLGERKQKRGSITIVLD